MSLLDELKEKRQDAIENFETQGADIEVTREQLADQQRVRAFWAAQIVDLDKAISALTPEGKEALLESQPEPIPTEVRKQDEQDAAGDWTNGGEDRLDAVCAELLAAPPPAQEAPAIPEGFTPWGGGERPTDATVGAVQVIFEDGSTFKERSTDVVLQDGSWTKLDPYSAYNIIAYRVVEPSAEAERTSDESQAETVNEQTLITDDIPSIPREEIPIGAAVETYTDSGLETVKISGTTYVVDDEPALPVAEAAYAPINAEEPAGDAAVFAHGILTEAKEPPLPSWLSVFKGKAKVDA